MMRDGWEKTAGVQAIEWAMEAAMKRRPQPPTHLQVLFFSPSSPPSSPPSTRSISTRQTLKSPRYPSPRYETTRPTFPVPLPPSSSHPQTSQLPHVPHETNQASPPAAGQNSVRILASSRPKIVSPVTLPRPSREDSTMGQKSGGRAVRKGVESQGCARFITNMLCA